MSNTNGKYLNGLFVEEKEGNYGPYISIGISKEGLEALQNLPVTGKGFRNFTLSRQKDNPAKFSAKPVLPKAQSGGDSGSTDDLPW